MISTLLVANRGEIARRVFRTCRELGIATVAVHSDPDAGALHVAEADEAVRLPGATPSQTYLRGDLIVEAARAAGADAIHPGYGFLSENAEFAQRVLDAGLTWVGPPPKAIESMGSKIESKRLMADAGVPVLGELEPAEVGDGDLPVLVKASAGGGGRGMRIVRSLDDLFGQIESSRSEIASAFGTESMVASGDVTVFCEPYLEHGRHIEVQVLADQHGEVWALGERECSIQRRHQKVVEEAPSPAVDEAARQQLCDAAVAAAKAIGYVGAGTVEFLAAPATDAARTTDAAPAADPAEAGIRFFFLEMNTRLQVEHPVTECVTGTDLVAWQLRIAEGAPLAGDPPGLSGHAIEVRLYAEDPAHDWQPQAGPLHRFAVPGVDASFAVPPGTGLRLDSGVAGGGAVSTYYDPMLAKLIAWAPTRGEAARRLSAALAAAEIHGLVTNRDLLVRVLRHPAFLAGETDTAFFDTHDLAALSRPLADPDAVWYAALAAALADAAANRRDARVLGRLPSGWRNVPSQPQRRSYRYGEQRLDVAYRYTRAGLLVDNPGADAQDAAASPDDAGAEPAHPPEDAGTEPGHSPDGGEVGPHVKLVAADPGSVTLEVSGVTTRFAVRAYPGMVCVDSARGPVTLRPVARFTDPAEAVAEGSLLAPMPGTVTAVHVAEGEAVTAGQPLLVLEAMKMQHPIAATEAGVVTSLRVDVGSAVDAGSVLAVVEPGPVSGGGGEEPKAEGAT